MPQASALSPLSAGALACCGGSVRWRSGGSRGGGVSHAVSGRHGALLWPRRWQHRPAQLIPNPEAQQTPPPPRPTPPSDRHTPNPSPRVATGAGTQRDAVQPPDAGPASGGPMAYACPSSSLPLRLRRTACPARGVSVQHLGSSPVHGQRRPSPRAGGGQDDVGGTRCALCAASAVPSNGGAARWPSKRAIQRGLA